MILLPGSSGALPVAPTRTIAVMFCCVCVCVCVWGGGGGGGG